MNAVRENPYRTLGIFGNTTEKELQKQIATIKRYSEVGKTKSFDYDFPFLGEFKREEQTVAAAASKIEQAKNKVHYSLFWFLNTNHVDDAALNHLKENHIDKATEIWEKLIKDNVITQKNYAAALNLSTLQLGLATLNGSLNPIEFKRCVVLKEQIISSDAYLNFVQAVAGNNTSTNKDTIRKEFVDEILKIIKPYLNKPKGISSAQLIDAFQTFPTGIKQYVSNKFTDIPLSNIESQVEKCKEKRIDNANDAEEYGEELYINTKEDLASLKSLLGSANVHYQVTSNKVVQEILQCAIDFYNEYQNNDVYDPGETTMKLIRICRSITPTGQTKTRLEETEEVIQEWIDDKPARDKNKKVKDDLEFIANKLQRFQNLTESISNVKDLIVSCKPKIKKIKTELGVYDELYICISSAVVQNAQNMLVATVNKEAEKFQQQQRISIYRVSTSAFEAIIKEALDLTFLLGDFDMATNLKSHYNENLTGIKALATQFSISTLSPKERLQRDIRNAENLLKEIQNKVFLKNEIDAANVEMDNVKQWQMFRSQSDRESQIKDQQAKIQQITTRGEQEKEGQVKTQQDKITELKTKLKLLE